MMKTMTGHGLGQPDNKPAGMGPQHTAKPAEHHHGKSRHDEVDTDLRRHRVERRKQAARQSGRCGTGTKAHHKRALDIDAHKPRRLAILCHGADGLARQRGFQEPAKACGN